MMDSVSEASTIPEESEASVGKYKLIASLGHGGMADVYLAAVSGPAGINKLQVIKRLRRESATDPERVAMFLDEARLAARVSHPNVVQTFEVGAAEGAYFIAMEWLEGAPLNRIMNRARTSPPPKGALLRILADVLAGLHHAHELCDYDGTPLNVVHRDASPHNVIVTYEGHIKLLDFGIAMSDVRAADPRHGAVQGKVQYMAPEQARAKELDRRADIFVMGIVLWEMLAGRKMWQRGSDMEILHKLATGDVPRLEDIAKDVPTELFKIVNHALAMEPRDRYSTAAEMRADILGYLDANSIHVGPEEIGHYVTEQYADKRAEIQRVIERQLGKLTGLIVSSPFHVDTPIPISVDPESLARLSSAPLGINGSGALPHIPAYRSIPPPPVERLHTPLPPPVADIVEQAPNVAPNMAPNVSNANKAIPPEEIPVPTTRPAPPDKASIVRFLGMAGVLVLVSVLFAFLALGLLRGQKHGSKTTEPLDPQPAGQTSPAPKTKITINISATPKEAKIFLDGTPLDTNPFSGEFPIDGIGHRIRAEAPAYSPAAQIVMFDKDNTIELVLTPK